MKYKIGLIQSKDFPVEMLTEITQQRKQRKMIIGTSQVFSRIAKPIREQTYMLYEPTVLFGCITFVRKYDVTTDVDGQASSKKYRGCFFFVQNEKIRILLTHIAKSKICHRKDLKAKMNK